MNDLERLLEVLPPTLAPLVEDPTDLIEIVLDTGRPFELRYVDGFHRFPENIVTEDDVKYACERVTIFGTDNRAGVNCTLHRVSRIVNRTSNVIGLTCRVGTPYYGCIDIIQDLIESGRNILILGRPGVGKTTKLRDVARYLADECEKRVVIVDTSNEIAGDGNVPHPAVGMARRLQVPLGKEQADVMIEAVENHMPEVIVIDEISARDEAWAARTISQRGVQLVATAHGREFSDLMKNPPLWTLLGGIKTVTISDSQAKQRGCNKTIQEREMEPVFDIVVELDGFERAIIYRDVATTVDAILRGNFVNPEIRTFENETVEVERGFRVVNAPRKPRPTETREKSGKDTRLRRRSR
jgi:stage III sporulation protein AA